MLLIKAQVRPSLGEPRRGHGEGNPRAQGIAQTTTPQTYSSLLYFPHFCTDSAGRHCAECAAGDTARKKVPI
jgi:hypothetical protein